jgi:RHH-type transcriptional regulator, proline utilization regulon repressor / proline dehydrogenase / delta 1-pyrroline-5-carboxylate dehydrogenase
VPPLLDLAALTQLSRKVEVLARSLVRKLRGKTRSSGVEGLIYEYSLTSQEGVALMCLTEANQRVAGRGVGDAQ